MDFKEIGRKIQQARITQNLRQGQLAEKVGVTTNFISQIERGISKMSVYTLYRVVGTLEISIDYFVGDRKNNTLKCEGITAELVDILNQMPDNKREIIVNWAKDILSLKADSNKNTGGEAGAKLQRDERQEFFTFVGKRIKQLRLERKLTQEAVGKEVGITINFISHIERCKSILSLETLVGIARALDVSVDFLTDNMFIGKIQRNELNGEIVDLRLQMSLNERLFLLNAAKEISAI